MVDSLFFPKCHRPVAGPSLTILATLAVLLIAVVAGCDWYGTRSFSADAITAYVVDADTGEPVAGANVLATWVMKSGLENNTTNYAMVMEAVSDASGKFTFPAWGPKNVSGLGQIPGLAPLFIIFKPGYNQGRGANRSNGPAPLHMTSDWNNKTFKLKKFQGTPEEYANYLDLYLLGDIHSLMFNGCHGISFPKFLLALDRQSLEFATQRTKTPLPSLQRISDSYASRCGPIVEEVRRRGS